MWESQYGKFGRKSPAADATSYVQILTFVCFEGEKTDGHLTQFTKWFYIAREMINGVVLCSRQTCEHLLLSAADKSEPNGQASPVSVWQEEH